MVVGKKPIYESSMQMGKEKIAEEDQGGGEDQSKTAPAPIIPATIHSLPPDILSEILVRIPPVKSVASSKLVNQTWLALISDPKFAKSHVEKATVCPLLFVLSDDIYHQTMYLVEGNNSVDLYPYTKPQFTSKIRFHMPNMRLSYRPTINRFTYHVSNFVVSSCEGLVAWTLSYEHFPVIICNPIIGEYFMIDDTMNDPIFTGIMKSIFIGIGFNPQTKRYELLRLSQMVILDSTDGFYAMRWFIEVLTLGVEPWRWIRIRDVSEKVGEFLFAEMTQVINIDGVIHWMHQGKSSICSFNFERRFFEVLPMANMYNEDSTVGGLGEVGGSLCVSLISKHDGHAEVWLMEINTQSSVMWARYYYIDTIFTGLEFVDHVKVKGHYRLIKNLEYGKILLQHSNDSFVVYDPLIEMEICHFRVIEDAPSLDGMKLVHHKPSLISLRVALMCDNIPVSEVHGRMHIPGSIMLQKMSDDLRQG